MKITDPVDMGNLKIQVAYLSLGEQAPDGFFFDCFRKDGTEAWIKYLGPSDAMQAYYVEALQAA